MTMGARMTAIPDRPGWFLSSVNRQTDDGYEVTEVGLTFFAEGDSGAGETLTFRIPRAQPRDVILAAAQEQIDRWAQTGPVQGHGMTDSD